MTTEELLRPRYKVIAHYPGMKAEGLSVGQILTCRNYDNDFSEKLWCEMNDAYPHLFKRLNWWKERDIEDMPEYVKCIKQNMIGGLEYDKVYKMEMFGDILRCFLPATLTEYQNQSK